MLKRYVQSNEIMPKNHPTCQSCCTLSSKPYPPCCNVRLNVLWIGEWRFYLYFTKLTSKRLFAYSTSGTWGAQAGWTMSSVQWVRPVSPHSVRHAQTHNSTRYFGLCLNIHFHTDEHFRNVLRKTLKHHLHTRRDTGNCSAMSQWCWCLKLVA